MTDPYIDLPRNLQSRKRKLLKYQEKIEKEIEEIDLKIKERRSKCKHEPVPGTENNYATYCRKCGYMIDSWL